jgi:hypothetical protein
MATHYSSLLPRSASKSPSRPPADFEAETDVEPPPSSPVEPPGALTCDNRAHTCSEPSNSLHDSKHSVANNRLYPSDITQNPALDHRRNALSFSDTTKPPDPALSTPRNATSGPTSGHRREISRISDFAYSPGDSRHTIRSPSEEDVSVQFEKANEELLARYSIAKNRSLDSTQTTAVNTARNISDASADEMPLNLTVDVYDPAQWEDLRRVVAAAQPGVSFTFTVRNGSPPSQNVAVKTPRVPKAGGVLSDWLSFFVAVKDTLVFMLKMSLIIGTVGACIAIIALISTGAAHILEYLFPFNISTIADFETGSQHLASLLYFSGEVRQEQSPVSPPAFCPVPLLFEEAIPRADILWICALGQSKLWRWFVYAKNLATPVSIVGFVVMAV